MTFDVHPDFRGLVIAAFIFATASLGTASAETLTYRFEAELSHAHIVPPENSVAAAALAKRRLSGTFGFESNARRTSEASNPGRVAFGSYDTGFITLNELDTGMIQGNFSVQVTDGVTQAEATQTTIVDEVRLGSVAISTDNPIDAIGLRVRYVDAERLQGVVLPTSFDREDIADISLTFSTRIDAMGNRSATPANEALGLVSFKVLTIQLLQ